MYSWQHQPDRLEIRLGDRVEHVPEPVEGLLIHASAPLSPDPAADLLRLDATLLTLARTLRADLKVANTEVLTLRAKRRATTGTRDFPHRPSNTALRTALERHLRLREQLDDVTVTSELLREFVMGLVPTEDPLRAAVEGWRRGTTPPAAVEQFVDEFLFLELDSRRARRAAWGGNVLAGVEEFGTHWRLDADDEPSSVEPFRMSGTWTLGYLPRTAEVYAVRRTVETQPNTLWLLGTAFELAELYEVLTPVLPQMRAPNSVILAATSIHAAQLARALRTRSEAS